MPYPFDDDDSQVSTAEADDERERRFQILRMGLPRKPVLGRGTSDEPIDRGNESFAPGSRGYDLAVGATAQPRVPSPRTTSVTPPTFDNPPASRTSVLGNAPSLLGRQPSPARPDVMPTRADFPAKPEVGGWRKAIGLGLATLAGPNAYPLAEQVLHGQERKAEKNYQGAVQDWEREQADQTRALQNRNIESEIKARETPKPVEVKPELETWTDLMKQGIPPREAYEILKSAGKAEPQAKPTFQEQSYAEWAKTHPGGTRMQFEKENAAATQRPERPEKPQRTLVTVPQPDGSAKVIEATPGMIIPKGARTVQEFGKEQTPSPDEQRRADLANNLTENLDRLEEIVKRRPELFGPASGRLTTAKQWLGTGDPDVAALENIKEQVGLAMVGAHAMRNAQHAEKAANSILNAYKNKPEALIGERGSIASARNSLKTFIGDVQGQRVQDKAAGGAKGGPSAQPLSLDEARDYLQKAGGDKEKARQLARQDGRKF
jgi:hypothetical protein